MKAPSTGTKPPPAITEYDMTERELLVEVLRHVRGIAWAVYVLAFVVAAGAVIVVLASTASTSSTT